MVYKPLDRQSNGELGGHDAGGARTEAAALDQVMVCHGLAFLVVLQ